MNDSKIGLALAILSVATVDAATDAPLRANASRVLSDALGPTPLEASMKDVVQFDGYALLKFSCEIPVPGVNGARRVLDGVRAEYVSQESAYCALNHYRSAVSLCGGDVFDISVTPSVLNQVPPDVNPCACVATKPTISEGELVDAEFKTPSYTLRFEKRLPSGATVSECSPGFLSPGDAARTLHDLIVAHPEAVVSGGIYPG